MKRVAIGKYQGNYIFRASRSGVNALTGAAGDDLILHEEMVPVAAVYGGVWAAGNNSTKTYSYPHISSRPFQVLMNDGQGTVMLDWTFYAEWNTQSKTLKLVNKLSARSIRFAVLVHIGDLTE